MASLSHSNPRKFSEKIALHRQKEAEEKAEYDKIMSECAMVKGRVPTAVGPTHNCLNSVHPPPAYGTMGPDITSRLIPPNISGSANRHGSLPNVNTAMQSHSGLHSDLDGSLLLDQRLGGVPQVHPQHHQGQHPSPHPSQPQIHHHQHHNLVHSNGSHAHHVSLREQQQHQAGPIRSSKNRIDTSPYGSSYQLLSPPNPVDWRRTVSDSSLHQSVHVSHENLSKGPSHLSSPHKKGSDVDGPSRFSSQKYLLPHDTGDKKPGSLPDLSSFTGVSNHLTDKLNGSGCSSAESSPPGIPNGSPGLVSNRPKSHLPNNPSSPDLTSWSPNPHQPEGGGGEYGMNHVNSHMSYGAPQDNNPMAYGGRSTSPIDVVGGGSPHSPSGGNPMSPSSPILPTNAPNNHCSNNNANSYEELGESYSQEQVDLNREFQRFTMMDSWDSSAQYSQSYYYRGNPSRYESNENQPMNELVNFLTNMDSKVNHPMHHSAPGCAQTPSGIPDIILTDDAGTDQDLQGLSMSNALECVNEDSLKADLGKLDDSMLRLLTESAVSDQAIADPVTEEHLKLI